MSVTTMATLLVWEYVGGADGSAEAKCRGEQRAKPGDACIDDVMGNCKLVAIEGSAIKVEFVENGETIERLRTKGHVRVLVVCERAHQPNVRPTRRHGPQQKTLYGLQGKDTPPDKLPPPKAKGLQLKPAAAAAMKRKAAQQTPAAARKQKVAQPATCDKECNGMALLMVYNETSSDDEAATPSPITQPTAGAGAGASKGSSIRKMQPEVKAVYRHDKYESRKEQGMVVWGPRYPWLKSSPLYGWHCSLCIKATHKAADKLATTGYGFIGEGDDRAMALVPAEAKLKLHEKDGSPHDYNSKNSERMTAGASQAAVMGDATVYLTITPEDELYARTIRTVHLICVRQLSLNDMDALLKLQHANGAIISFDHANVSGISREVDDGDDGGGVHSWLAAGARVFCKLQRDRAKNSIMAVLFPRGLPFGFMGDGSNDRSLCEQEAVVLRWLGGNGRPYNCFHDLAELDLKASAM